ncbi:MAG: divergent polysaccharide deacetylase family protein [Candidatus Omnitrophota bacterium]
MNRYPLLITIIVVALGVTLFGCQSKNITKKVLKAEKTVLFVLYEYGLTNEDILSREEERWKGRGLRVMKVKYEFKAGGGFKALDLAETLRKELRRIRGVRLGRIFYKGAQGSPRAVDFEVSYKDKTILTAVINTKFFPKQKMPSAKIVLVLDDFGYTKKNLENLRSLGIPITMAVLPNAPYTEAVCSFAEENDFEVLLHLPLEPEAQTDSLEKNTIITDMNDESIESIVKNAFRSVFCARGVSNHMGSKATRDERLMKIIMNELSKRNMFFLDSLTTDESVCESAALSVGVVSVRRDIFIDNKTEKPYIEKKMEEAVRMAFAKGRVVVIGHDRSITVEVLKEIVPRLKKQGVKFTTLSTILKPNDKRQATNNDYPGDRNIM